MEWVQVLTALLYQMAERFQVFGPLWGILLPIIEAFFPPLSITVIIAVNLFVYGYVLGYVYSWLGTCIGSLMVFYIIRNFFHDRFHERLKADGRADHYLEGFTRHGFWPVLLLSSFPFIPSLLVIGSGALSDISFRTFAIALSLGKLVMVFLLAYLGYSAAGFFVSPWRTLLLLLLMAVFWVLVIHPMGSPRRRWWRRLPWFR